MKKVKAAKVGKSKATKGLKKRVTADKELVKMAFSELDLHRFPLANEKNEIKDAVAILLLIEKKAVETIVAIAAAYYRRHKKPSSLMPKAKDDDACVMMESVFVAAKTYLKVKASLKGK